MKKILIAILIFVTFIIHANAAPPPMIIIRSEEIITEMREMAEADDKELLSFLIRTNYDMNGIRNRDDLIWFLELIDSLPIPYVEGTEFLSLSYSPGSQRFYVFFETEIEEYYSYYYFLNENYYERPFPTRPQYFNLNSHGAISFMMEIEGFNVSVGYNRGNNEHITTFNPYETYKNMIVTSFREAPWSTLDTEDEQISFTTADALTVLRAATGMAMLTEAEVVRFGIVGELSTADALRILRIAVGLSGV